VVAGEPRPPGQPERPTGSERNAVVGKGASAIASEAPVRILVVDDREENVVALQSILGGDEFELVVARSGSEALGQLLTADVAVVLMDVLMPLMDGFETARLIRAREACRHIPIIFLTAVGSDLQMVERGYAVGAVDYLVKPLNPEMVKAKVAVFVDLYRKNRQLRRHEEVLRMAERARSEEVLRETEALYEASFNSAAVGITHLEVDGRWRRVNPQFCKITGYSVEEASHLRVQDVVHPADVAEDLEGLKRLARGEIENLRRQERYVRKDGRVVWVDLTVSPLRDPRGGVRYFVAVVEDITARRDAEKRERLLAEVSQLLLSSPDHRDVDSVVQTIVAALGDWCIIGVKHPEDDEQVAAVPSVACADQGREGLVSRLRGALASSAAYARWLTEPQALTSVDPDSELGRLWGLDRKLLADVGAVAALSLPLSARSRAFGHVTFLATHPFDAGDVTTAYEVTRRIALALENGDLYRQTQDAVRARDEFLSIASHELRTPLTPLRIHLQRLLSRSSEVALADPNRVQTVLHRCERKVRRLEALVDTLFEVSRLNREKLRLQLDTVDLGDLARKVVDSFAEEMMAAGCQPVVQVHGAVTGRWDRLRLEQVIANVVENAIKYGPGKPIEIEVHGTDEQVRLTVRDHGVGIPQTQLEEIFERFQRIVSSPYHSGLRLGLSITRQIVEAHSGRIHAESQPGAGARFTIELPRHVDEALPDSPSEESPESRPRLRAGKDGEGSRRAC